MASKNPGLSSYYGNLIVNVAKKNVLKIHPDIKRQMCKKCRCILIDKGSAKMLLRRKNKTKLIQWTCKICDSQRTFPSDEGSEYCVWLERPEAVVEII